MAWFRKSKPPQPSPAEVSAELRKRALDALGELRAGDQLGGIVVDWGLEKAVATLVCMADGTTSLYYSSGGGVIGAGTHASVRRASEALLATAARVAGELRDPEDGRLPVTGDFRFHVAGADGPHSATVTLDALTTGAHPLSVLFAAAQGVITAIRESALPK